MNPSNQQYKGPRLAPTPVSDHHYTGVTVDPKKRGSLTSHGAFLPHPAPTQDAQPRGGLQAAESLTSLRKAPGLSALDDYHKNKSFDKMGRTTLTHAGTSDSPPSSEADIYPSSGVPLRRPDSTMPTTTLPQHASFSQLAEIKGIHDWNHSVFDDRWLLQPEEIWNLEARRDSTITVSPKRLTLNRNTSHTGNQMGSRTEGFHHSLIQDARMQQTVRKAGEKKNEHHDRQVSTTLAEKRGDENSETLATTGKLATGQKGSLTNQ